MNSHRRPHILIADHDRTFLDQLTERLLQMNMEVDFAENGRAAIKLIEAADYDLVISEIAMPLNNGLEVLRRAKELNPKVAFLMFSFPMTKDFAEQSLKEGAYDYILRPLEDIREFDRAVIRGLKQGESHYPAPSSRSVLKEEKIADRAEAPRKTRMYRDESMHPIDHHQKRPVQPTISGIRQKDESPFELAQQPSEVLSLLPEGIIEVNQRGQILSCNSTARKWLELDAKTPERPIKQYLHSLSSGAAPDQIRVKFNGHQAYIMRKHVGAKEGGQRIILLFREAQDAIASRKMEVRAANRGPQGNSRRAATAEISFSDSVKKAPIETYSQGWSPLLFFDSLKKNLKEEVNHFLENNPIDWINQFHQPEMDETDPEITSTVNHRLSSITGSQRSPYSEVT